MEPYNYENLNTLIGNKVQIIDSFGNEAALKVKEVNKTVLDGEEWEAFSVIYEGDNQLTLPQGTYTFKHETFSELPLFLSPNSETEYETVVTRKR